MRGTDSGGRRDLEVLRAAVKHYKREYGMLAEPVFTLPEKSLPRDRWLTRSEAARLIWACYRPKGSWKGVDTEGDMLKRRHLVRFILIAIYTGTRHDAILRLGWMPNTLGGWADLEKGVMYRRAPRTCETKKRTPTISIPDRLLAHMKRWRRLDAGIQAIVNYNGKPISRLEKSFRSARAQAGLDDSVIPHALRHTAITWLMQSGIDINEVSSFCGVSVEELERTYWHHHPDFQQGVRTVRMGQRKQKAEPTKAANAG
jgi:integrase